MASGTATAEGQARRDAIVRALQDPDFASWSDEAVADYLLRTDLDVEGADNFAAVVAIVRDSRASPPSDVVGE